MALPAQTLPPRTRVRRFRFKRAKKLLRWQRERLGLQPHVGVTSNELARATYYRQIEILIARELAQAESVLKPLARIGFGGRPAPTLITTLENPANERLTEAERTALMGGYIAVRNTASCPLDYFYHQSKAGIEFWEWLAGKRFEYDWHVASGSHKLAQSLDGLMQVRVAKLTRAERRQLRLRPPTFKPRKAKRPRASATEMPDSRLDAMARLGRLCDCVSNVSWFLLVEIVGNERWAKDVAGQLVQSPEYVATRFREALCEAALHYSLGPASKPRER